MPTNPWKFGLNHSDIELIILLSPILINGYINILYEYGLIKESKILKINIKNNFYFKLSIAV